MLVGRQSSRRALCSIHQGTAPIRNAWNFLEHISLPEDDIDPAQGLCVVSLGVKHGTKNNRPQFMLLHENDPRDKRAIHILRLAKKTSLPGLPIFAFSYQQWNNLFRRASVLLKLREAATAHSPRPGWATDQILAKMAFSEVQERGRWSSPQSLRIYLDAVGAAAQRARAESAGWAHLSSQVENDFWRFVPVWW